MIEDSNSSKPELPKGVSPLSEASPFSLNEFMSRDPFEYSSDQSRMELVKCLRLERARWESLEKDEKRLSKTEAKGEKKEPPKALSLEDLGL